MDQNRRFLLFLVLTGAVWFTWIGFVQPKLFPPAKKAPVAESNADAEAIAEDDVATDGETEPTKQTEESNWVEPKNPARPNLRIGSLDASSGYFLEVTTNSRGASISSIALNDDRYKDLDDRDAALHIVGHDAVDEPQTMAMALHEFDDQLARFKTTTNDIDWKVEKTILDKDNPKILRGVVFSLTSPDQELVALKSYQLNAVKDSTHSAVRDTNPNGYVLDVDLTFRNIGNEKRQVSYTLQGPVGLPLENREHTSKYRELELGFLDREGEIASAVLTADDATELYAAAKDARNANEAAAKADRLLRSLERTASNLEAQLKEDPQNEKLKKDFEQAQNAVTTQQSKLTPLTDAARDANTGLERWDTPFRYLGVEVQYFVSLLFPKDKRAIGEQFENPWIAVGEPIVFSKGKDANFNDISFELTSKPIALEAGAEVTQSWSLYSGPKRNELLEPLGADGVMDLGWFAWVSRGMLWILEHLHSLGLPYWLAIISLTVIVRGAMFPISRKQAIGAAKMKELQPKLTELKTKYGNDQEKMLRAQMELFRKHGYGPLGPMASGCLPVLLQLPIFIGLYQALQTSVDLRMAPFLWIDNLAAPDELFQMPFSLPYLGADFNLLPLITVVLFYIQQKLFMPPPTSKEQEAQYKMMNFMMLFMGFFFYHVPAGLCVYFIASSLWSIGERTLLSKTKAAHIGPAEAAEIEHEIEELEAGDSDASSSKGKKGNKASIVKGDTRRATKKEPPKPPTWLEKLLDAADASRRDAELGGGTNKLRDRPAAGSSRKKSKFPRR